jgi:hypothetical protein
MLACSFESVSSNKWPISPLAPVMTTVLLDIVAKLQS